MTEIVFHLFTYLFFSLVLLSGWILNNKHAKNGIGKLNQAGFLQAVRPQVNIFGAATKAASLNPPTLALEL